jgi:hypothetical protein
MDPMYKDELGKFLKRETQRIIDAGPVPARRGTGPKARLTKFLEAFDAYEAWRASRDGAEVDLNDRLLGEALHNAMMKARRGITTNLGLG